MKVLITGGAGFIGCNVARYFFDKGSFLDKEIVILDNLIREGAQNNLAFIKEAEFIRGDVRNNLNLMRLGEINAIIHCAANPGIPKSINNPVFDFKNNALGTLNVLEFARKNDCPVIYCSTNKVYPEDLINSIPLYEPLYGKRYEWEQKGFPKTNLVGGRPHSPYGVSKLCGDLYCQEYHAVYGLPTVVNRMSCVYGTHQYGTEEQGWVAHFVFSALTNKELNIFGNGKQVRDMLWIEDLTKLFLLELKEIDKFKGTVWNVGGGHKNTMSLLECIEYLEKRLKIKFKLNFDNWRPADHKVYISNIGDLEKYWTPTVSPKEGIDKLMKWAKAVVK